MSDSNVCDAMALSARCAAALAGQPPQVQGAALADLLATWLAGFHGGSTAESAALRARLLKMHVATVRQLVAQLDQT